MSAITERIHLDPAVRREFEMRGLAMSGDLVIVCLPAVTTRPATSEHWERGVEISLRTRDGRVHDWFDGWLHAVATALGMPILHLDADFQLVNGRCLVRMNAYHGGQPGEANTLTVTGRVLGYDLAPATSVETVI